jgi:tRNA threonylcarbamoyladenosine biosynthesis protein TsaB
MLILALDTSTRRCSLAVMRDEEVLAATGGISSEPYASRVFNDLSGILRQSGVELPQIELFAVACGPGSFTGLRVGLSAVKGWSEVFGRPVAPVSVLEAIAVQAQGAAPLIAPVLDARGGQLYGGVFRPEGAGGRLKAVGEEVVLSPQEYLAWLGGIVGPERPLFVTSTPPFIGRIGLECSRRGGVVDSLGLEANYVRRSDAEVKWRGG